MALTEEERGWALAIKRELEASNNAPPISDFEIVQHALFSREDTTGAVHRIRKLHLFKEEYCLHDKDVSQSSDLIAGLLAQHLWDHHGCRGTAYGSIAEPGDYLAGTGGDRPHQSW